MRGTRLLAALFIAVATDRFDTLIVYTKHHGVAGTDQRAQIRKDGGGETCVIVLLRQFIAERSQVAFQPFAFLHFLRCMAEILDRARNRAHLVAAFGVRYFDAQVTACEARDQVSEMDRKSVVSGKSV